MGLALNANRIGSKPILLLLFVLFGIPSCITIEKAPNRLVDDGSGKFDCGGNPILYSTHLMTILEISPIGLQEIVKNSEGMIYVWAPWCAPCYLTLKHNYASTFDDIGNHVFLSVNYDIKNIVKLLETKVDTAYVLSCSAFGKDEMDKARGISFFLMGRELEQVPQLYKYRSGKIDFVQ